MRLCSIVSGSSGNCIYAGSDDTHIMIDAGISGKRIEAGLNQLGLKTCEMQGILVTHEHIDHISGLGVVARRFGIPIYATEKTIVAIISGGCAGVIEPTLFRVVRPDESFSIGDITVTPISISHDAADPVAYRMENGKRKCAVVTDLGVYNDYIIDNIKGLDVLFLEANHDIRMLQVGPYPYYLKQRILGDKGHLSNENSGRLLGSVLHDNFKMVMLGHLSKENNYAELAYETVRCEVNLGDNPYNAADFPIKVARRDELSEVINF